MKLRLGFSAVLAAVALLSCQKEELAPEENRFDGALLTFTSEEPSSTKTEWNGSTIVWSAGDAISVAYTLDGAWKNTLYASDALTESVSKAGFNVPTDLAPETEGKLVFYGLHPAVATTTDFSAAPSLTVNVPSNQTPGVNTYDKSADIMVAKAFVDYNAVPKTAIPLLWNRIVAHADLTFSNLAVSSDETPETLVITAQQGAALAGDITLNIKTSEHTVSEQVTNQLTLDLSALTISEAGALNVWTVLLPSEITSLTVDLTTSKARYVREITGMTASFAANTRSAMTINMSEAEKLTKPEENSTINTEVFELLNLDYPGLETVKAEYEAGNYGVAAAALVDYFRTRPVVNPEADLSVKKLYSEEARLADQLLEHRICIRKGKWYESVTTDENGTKRYTYYDFDDENGEIDWYFEVPDIGQEDYQLHWHDYFKYLAWAQNEKGDDKYIECWKELYTDWLETFPGPEGNNLWATFYNKAWHQLSTSNRIVNQLNNLPYFLTSSAFTGSWMSEFLVKFHELVEFDRSHTYHDLTSNVTFEQYTARATAGILMPEFKNAQTWLSDAALLISNQFTVQFLEDGVHSEMSPKYHMGVLDNFRIIYNLARANDRLGEFTPDYTEKMRAAALFLANYVYPNYTWEMFNDSGRQTENVLRNNIARYSKFFPDENVLTYLGSDRTEGTEPTESLISYPYGGYYIFRSNWREDGMMFILKNNYDPNNEPHVHPDNGTFSLFKNGRNFLPNAGYYTYGGTTELDAKREQYLATANHNTLTKNLETIATDYSLGECLLTRTSAAEDLVVTQNPSYSDLTHRRAVYMLDKEFFVIVDEAFGNAAAADINLSFHLCAGDIVVDDNSSAYSYGVHTNFTDGNNILLRTFSETATGFAGETGTSYCSENENTEYARPYYRVTVDKSAASDVTRFITVIYPATSAEISAEFTSEFSQSSSSVKVTVGGKEYNLSYTL